MICFVKIILLAEVTLGSWNMKFFPSGRSEHRVSARVEKANYEDAAEIIGAGLRPKGNILFFQELRDAKTTTNLVASLARTNVHPAVTSAFRYRGNRLGWQQCAIVTDLPVVEARWAPWRETDAPHSPRGYAYALVDAGADGLIACYCIHLKSDYHAATEDVKTANVAMREQAARELVDRAAQVKSPDGRPIAGIVIAGDFNTDPFGVKRGKHATAPTGERTTQILEEAGFANCFAGVPRKQRGTHPGGRNYPDTTIDFFFYRGLNALGRTTLAPHVPLSDHRMIWLTVEKSGADGAK